MEQKTDDRVCKTPNRYLYMAVTADALELPVAVTDTIDELAVITGCKASNIRTYVTPSRAIRYAHSRPSGVGFRFYRVPADEMEA